MCDPHKPRALTKKTMIQKIAATFCSKEKGAQLVEFALILPLLLVIVVGIIEFGRGFNIYHNVTNGTREGARLSAKPENNVDPTLAPNNIMDRIVNYLNALGLTTSYYTGAGALNASISPTAWVYGTYPSGSYFVIDQRSKMQKLDASGIPIINSFYLGSRVSIAYPYNFTFFKGVINLILATSAYNNQIYIKNTSIIENE